MGVGVGVGAGLTARALTIACNWAEVNEDREFIWPMLPIADCSLLRVVPRLVEVASEPWHPAQ